MRRVGGRARVRVDHVCMDTAIAADTAGAFPLLWLLCSSLSAAVSVDMRDSVEVGAAVVGVGWDQ